MTFLKIVSLIIILATVTHGADVESIRMAWNTDPDLARYAALKVKLNEIEKQNGDKGDARNTAFNELGDYEDVLCKTGKICHVRVSLGRGSHEKDLSRIAFSELFMLRKYNMEFYIPSEAKKNCSVSMLIPPALTADYVSIIKDFMQTGKVGRASDIKRITSREMDPEILAYDKLKEMYRYGNIVPDNSDIDKRLPLKSTAEQQELVYAALEKLQRDGRIVEVVALVPLGKCQGEYDASSLRKNGLEVGWDWNATKDERLKSTSVFLKVPNGMVVESIKLFFEMEGVPMKP